jgi:hypothetical protein
MRYLWVRFNNGKSDIVPQEMLHGLIASEDIAQFYRPSESRWITLGIDRIRGKGGRYGGPDRRTFPEIVSPRWIETAA